VEFLCTEIGQCAGVSKSILANPGDRFPESKVEMPPLQRALVLCRLYSVALTVLKQYPGTNPEFFSIR
jgi:hypothetical protein